MSRLGLRGTITADLRRHRGWVRGAIFAAACALCAAHGDIIAIFAWWLS